MVFVRTDSVASKAFERFECLELESELLFRKTPDGTTLDSAECTSLK